MHLRDITIFIKFGKSFAFNEWGKRSLALAEWVIILILNLVVSYDFPNRCGECVLIIILQWFVRQGWNFKGSWHIIIVLKKKKSYCSHLANIAFFLLVIQPKCS